MRDLGTRPIETPRLLLRKIIRGDAEDLFEGWASDPEVARYVSWRAHKNIEMSRQLIGSWLKGHKRPHNYQWAIQLKETGRVVGDIAVVRKDLPTRTAAMGYCLSRSLWGRGLMTEALQAVLDYLFDQVGFNRIEAEHDTENPASGRVMAKAGMLFEGVRRQARLDNQGNPVDVACYAILASDRSPEDMGHQ